MAEFYHVLLIPKPGVTEAQVEKAMNLTLDWFRYGGNCWILYTTSDAAKLHARLRPLVHTGGNLFICKLDVTDRQGWITKDLWEWLRKNQALQKGQG